MAINTVIQVGIKGVQQVVGGLKAIGGTAAGLVLGFSELQNQVVQKLGPAYSFFVLQNERLNQEILKTQGNIAANARVFNALGVEIDNISEKIQATRPALREALLQLEEDTRELVGVTSRQVNEAFTIVLENIGRIAGQSQVFTDPLDSAIELSKGVVAALGAIGLPLQQVRQEFRALISGELRDRNAILAQTLNISRREFNIAKANGELVDFLNDKLQVFIETNKLQAQTILGIGSNIRDLFEIIGRELGEPLLEPITQGLRELDEILKANRDLLVTSLTPSFQLLGEIIGQTFSIFNSLAEGLLALLSNPIITKSLEFLLTSIKGLIAPLESLFGVLREGQFTSLRDAFSLDKDAADDIETFGDRLQTAFDTVKNGARELNEEFERFLELQERSVNQFEEFDAENFRSELRSGLVEFPLSVFRQLAEESGLDVNEVARQFDQAFREEAIRVQEQFPDVSQAVIDERATKAGLEALKEVTREAAAADNAISSAIANFLFFGKGFEGIRDLITGEGVRARGLEAAANAAKEQARIIDELFTEADLAALQAGKTAEETGEALDQDAQARVDQARQRLRVLDLELRETQKRLLETSRDPVLAKALTAQGEEQFKAIEALANQLGVRLSTEGARVGERFFDSLGDIGTQAEQEFDQLGRSLEEAFVRNPEELSKSIKIFEEATRTAVNFGAVTSEEAVKQIDAILNEQRILFTDQIRLLKLRGSILRQETKANIDALQLERNALESLVLAGAVDDFTSELADASLTIEQSQEQVNLLLKERAALLSAIELSAEKAREQLAQELEIDVSDLTDEQIVEAQNRAIEAREKGAAQLDELDRKISRERIKQENLRLEAINKIFDEELEALEEFTQAQTQILEKANETRRTAQIAFEALNADARAEANLRSLQAEEEQQESLLEIQLAGLQRRIEIARNAPALTQEQQREVILDVDEEINKVLSTQNDILENTIKQVQIINEERQAALENEQQIEKIQRDQNVSEITQSFEQQSTLLSTSQERLGAINQLEQARLDLLKAQRESREEVRSLEQQALEAALEFAEVRKGGDVRAREEALVRAQAAAREAGISFRRFESEESIRRKLAQLDRRRADDQRMAERERFEGLARQFQLERQRVSIDAQRERIRSAQAQAEAEAGLAEQQAELESLRFQRQSISNSREEVSIALERRRAELEATKARLEGIRQAVREAIDGEATIAAARRAIDEAREIGADPSAVAQPFLDRLNARIDAGIAAVDTQIAAIDTQLAEEQQLSAEEQRQLDLLDAQIIAKERAIEATRSQIAFLQQEAQAQEDINRLVARQVELRQRAQAVEARFAVGRQRGEGRQLQEAIERLARQPIDQADISNRVLQQERSVRQRVIPASQAITQGLQMPTGFQRATQQSQLINQQTQALAFQGAVDKLSTAADKLGTSFANMRTVTNNTTVNPVVLGNPSQSLRKVGR